MDSLYGMLVGGQSAASFTQVAEWASVVRRKPKWDTRAGLAKVQIGGLPKSIGVWDSGRGQTKGGSVHGEGYREGNQAGDAVILRPPDFFVLVEAHHRQSRHNLGTICQATKKKGQQLIS